MIRIYRIKTYRILIYDYHTIEGREMLQKKIAERNNGIRKKQEFHCFSEWSEIYFGTEIKGEQE